MHLPNNIRGELNRLRKLRNDVAHRGSCVTQDLESAVKLVAAAIFGIRYAEILREAVRGARADGRLPKC